MSGWSRGWLVALAVALTLHAACTGDDSDDDSSVITDPIETTESTSSTSSSSTTETTVDPQAELEAEVEAAYLAYWDAFLEIYADPHPEDPLVDQHTAGAVREATLDSISQLILDGQSLHPPENPEQFGATVLYIDLQQGQAQVRACLIDGSRLVENETGSVLTDAVVTRLLEAVVVDEDNQWKVAESTVVEERDGTWDCDA